MKTVLITGANRGIGKALAIELGLNGFHVFIGAKRSVEGKATEQELTNLGISCTFLKLNVALDTDIEEAKDYISTHFGKLDLLINNAGMMHEEEGWIGNTTLELTEKALTTTFVTNFIGPWKICKAMVPLMESNSNAQILNISAKIASLTLGSDKRNPVFNSKPFAYNASKGALNQLTVHLAHALRRNKIRVLSIYPGWVQTEMGGEKATYTPSEAAKKIVSVIENEEFSSGTFIDFDHEIPW